MSFLSRILGRETKAASSAPTALCIQSLFEDVPQHDNPYVARCADLKATVCASIRPVIMDADGNECSAPAVERILRRPNPVQSWKDVVYGAVADLSIHGNGFIFPLPVEVQGRRIPGEMWQVPRANVSPQTTGRLFRPVTVWQVGSGDGTYLVPPEEMVHIHTRLQSDMALGISPLDAIRQSIAQQAAARTWNVSLMRNGAKPTIAILNPGEYTEEQVADLRATLDTGTAGGVNAGRYLYLQDGMTVQAVGYSAVDMDFANAMTVTAREIAIGMGVPPELIGDSANKTYSNAQEANREFAEHTILPILEQLYGQLTRVLEPYLPEGVRIGYDMAQVDAIKGGREALMTALAGAGYLTVNEKRAMLAFDAVEGGDTVMVSAGEIPITDATAPLDELASAVRREPS